MLKIALTGGIATGKSHVVGLLQKRGIACLDADALAHGVTASGTEATQAIAARFGSDVIALDGAVDRAKLGPLVFADEQARRDLEAIVHPAVYRAIAAGTRAFERMGEALVIVDVPLLYETGHEKEYDRVIVTSAPVETQVDRLTKRGLSDQEARRRIAAQMPVEEKAARADFVIRTDGSFEDTARQVDGVLAQLQRQEAEGKSQK